MMLMAIDHIRDYVARSAQQFLPTVLTRTTPASFFTRWITHFCAPVFMLTAGMGAYFYLKGRGPAEAGPSRQRIDVSRFLVTRGLWLIVLELTLMQFAYNFNLSTSNPIFLL